MAQSIGRRGVNLRKAYQEIVKQVAIEAGYRNNLAQGMAIVKNAHAKYRRENDGTMGFSRST
ncbi:MAG: hypothetical protein V4690_00805 [Patescibacteria group bacterium]